MLNKKENKKMINKKRTEYLPSRASYQTRKPTMIEAIKRHFTRTPVACYVVRAIPVLIVLIAGIVG